MNEAAGGVKLKPAQLALHVPGDKRPLLFLKEPQEFVQLPDICTSPGTCQDTLSAGKGQIKSQLRPLRGCRKQFSD